MATGYYGIESVPEGTPNAIECGTCGLAWLEDITPSGRCPFEGDHEEVGEPIKFKLEITLGNDAMKSRDDVLRSILNAIDSTGSGRSFRYNHETVESGGYTGLFDANGNRVGRWWFN